MIGSGPGWLTVSQVRAIHMGRQKPVRHISAKRLAGFHRLRCKRVQSRVAESLACLAMKYSRQPLKRGMLMRQIQKQCQVTLQALQFYRW